MSSTAFGSLVPRIQRNSRSDGSVTFRRAYRGSGPSERFEPSSSLASPEPRGGVGGVRRRSSSNRPSSAGTGDRLSFRLLGVAKISCGAQQCWNRDSPDWLVTPSVSAASQTDTLMHPLPDRGLMLDGSARSGKVPGSFQPQTVAICQLSLRESGEHERSAGWTAALMLQHNAASTMDYLLVQVRERRLNFLITLMLSVSILIREPSRCYA